MRLFRKKQGVYLACLKNKAKDKKKKLRKQKKLLKKKKQQKTEWIIKSRKEVEKNVTKKDKCS